MRLHLRYLAAACLIGLAGGAQAALMSALPNASGQFSMTDNTGPGTPITYHATVLPSTAPDRVVYYDSNPVASQDPANIATHIAFDYNVDASTLRYVAGCDNLSAGCAGATTTSHSFSLAGLPQFDYLAINIGGGELFFHWAQPITAMTLSVLEGFPVALGNYRAYLTTPVPGAFALFLTALGVFGLRRKMAKPADEQPLAAA